MGITGPIVWGVEDLGACMPESSNWQSGWTSMVWACCVELLAVFSFRSLQPSLSWWGGRVSSSQTHISESVPYFIWTSEGCSCSVTGSRTPFFISSLREVGWWRINPLLLLRTLQPPPPPPFACLVRLLETPTSTSDSSESSELPSYGSKN